MRRQRAGGAGGAAALRPEQVRIGQASVCMLSGPAGVPVATRYDAPACTLGPGQRFQCRSSFFTPSGRRLGLLEASFPLHDPAALQRLRAKVAGSVALPTNAFRCVMVMGGLSTVALRVHDALCSRSCIHQAAWNMFSNAQCGYMTRQCRVQQCPSQPADSSNIPNLKALLWRRHRLLLRVCKRGARVAGGTGSAGALSRFGGAQGGRCAGLASAAPSSCEGRPSHARR